MGCVCAFCVEVCVSVCGVQCLYVCGAQCVVCTFLCVSICHCVCACVCAFGVRVWYVCMCLWCKMFGVYFARACVGVYVDLFAVQKQARHAGTARCIFEKFTVKNYFVANNTFMPILRSFEPFCGIAKMKTDSKYHRIVIRCYLPQNSFLQCIFQKYT